MRLSSKSIQPKLSFESRRTSSDSSNDSTDGNFDEYLIPTRAKSSKKIKICTLCGRYRAIVRSTIAKAQLDFRSVNIEQIQNDSFRLRAQLELSNTGSIPATIMPPLIINVDNLGIVTNNEAITIKGDSSGKTIVPIDSPFVVTDLSAFYKFTHSLVFESNVIWHLKAEATIKPISSHMLSYSKIPFNKDVKLNALNGLPNVSIDYISLNRSDQHHILVDLIIKIINPSIFNIDVGQLYFTLQYNNWSIGYVESTSNNVTIHSGENSITCFGELQSTSTESFQALSTVIQNFLTGQISKVEALAGPNVSSYPLLAIGMMGLSLNVPMPPFNEQLIVSLKFNSMSLIPSITEKKVKLAASIIIQINSPLGQQSPLNIQTMDMSTFLVYENNSVGMLNVSQVPVKQLDTMTFETKFDNKYLILTDTGINYEKFTQDFIKANQTHPINFRLVGVASIVGSFALGPLHIDGILVENNVSLVGLNGFNNVHVDGISVDGEEESALRLSINVTIENAGVTEVQLEDFSLYMAEAQNGTVLGQIPIDILAVEPGSNEISLNGLLAPLHENDLPVIGKFFSSYLNGQTQEVKLFHNQSSEQNATAMDLTISGLSMKANLNGIQTKLIRQVNVLNFGIEFDSIDVNKIYITGQLSVLFELPSNVHMTFKIFTTSIEFIMRFNNGSDMSKMILNNIPVEHNQVTNEIFLSFTKQQLIVLNNESFEEFAANLILTTNVSVMIQGLTAALTEVRIGNITLTDIPISDTLHLTGYNQFDNGHLIIDNIDITGSISSQALALHVKTQIINPSVVNIINGGRLTLDLCDSLNFTSLGTIDINPFYLQPQNNATIINAEAIFNITEHNNIIARKFISNMVSGIDSEVELRGTLPDNSTGTSIPLLSLAIAGLRIQTKVPGLTGDRQFIREIIVKKLTAGEIIGIPLGLVKTLSIRVRLINPFSTSISIQSMRIRADFSPTIDEDHQIGTVEDHAPFTVNPHQDLITSYKTVTLSAKLSTMIALLSPLLSGNARLSLSGVIDVTIGDNFTLNQLPLTTLNVTTDQEHSH
ncbi:unnamed protein product [Adineta steineri]|uniref:Uncharacterized protein n=1 Tax=Adineta steineri TaxID=433720 RepID=A0A816E526_9BILA|nr:unnamed protein product [Adineta steineri]CAF1644379.1 unnamed protein product [Adineta steineri]